MTHKKQQNNWYKDFFEKFYFPYFHFHRKKENSLKIKKEINFICGVLGLLKGARVLDLACGAGRHALELSRKGYDVTGVDFNKQFLEIAKNKAQKRNLPLKLIRRDVRSLLFRDEFGAVICMYTSFGYFINEKENTKALKNISKSLKKGGLLLLDLPNKYWTINKIPKKISRKVGNKHVLEERSFDKKKNIFCNKITIIDARDGIEEISVFLHLYGLKEIKNKLTASGLRTVRLFGNYDIKSKFHSTKSLRMIVLAKK